MRDVFFDDHGNVWSVSRLARERRIGSFVDIRYLVTDNLLGDVQTIGQRECSKNGDKRGTRSGKGNQKRYKFQA